MELLAQHPGGLTFTEICTMLQWPKSTAHDLIATLQSESYLNYSDDTRRYRLGLRIIAIGANYLQSSELLRAARAETTRLSHELGEHVHLAIREAAQAIYIALEQSSYPMRLQSEVGQRVPAHATATGKVLLASLPESELLALLANRHLQKLTPHTITAYGDLRIDLEEVRRLGVAFDCEEYAPGLYCVAAPILDAVGDTVAALGVSVSSARLDGKRLHQLVVRLKQSAEAVSGSRGHPGAAPRRAGRVRLAWSMADLTVPFYKEVHRTLSRLRAQLDLDLLFTNARDSESKQVADVHALLDASPDILVIHPTNTYTADELFREAAARGVATICFQRPARSLNSTYFVGGDTYEVGVLQVEHMARFLGGKGRVAVFEGDPYNDNARNISLGNVDSLSKHPGLELVHTQACLRWSPEEAAVQAARLLDLDPHIDGIIAHNDPMAGRIADVLSERGLAGRIVLLGSDGDPETILRIRAGVQHGTAFQDPGRVAEEAVNLALQIVSGGPDPATLASRSAARNPSGPQVLARDIPYMFVTAENVGVLDQYWANRVRRS